MESSSTTTLRRTKIEIIIVFIISFYLNGEIIFTAPELIGRVTDSSITINFQSDSDLDYYYLYGSESENYSNRYPESGHFNSIGNQTTENILTQLEPNEIYYYRLVYSSDSGNSWIYGDEGSFHTQRELGDEFKFTITSDSHYGTHINNHIKNLYKRTLKNVDENNPDLHFDLGDTFSITNIEIGDSISVAEEYLSQREIMGEISNSAPIYLVIGNHEDEEGWNLDDAGDDFRSSKPIMSSNARKRYYLNPTPDSFYSGDSNSSNSYIDGDHLRESYYSFEWGDALFIALDPFWNTATKPYSGTLGGEEDDEIIGNRWDWSLGEEQYLWLIETMESSSAKWKFVFSHHVVGGKDDYGRGGAEATNGYE